MSAERFKAKPRVRDTSKPVELSRFEVLWLAYDATRSIEELANKTDVVGVDEDFDASDVGVRDLLHRVKQIEQKAKRASELLESLLDEVK